MLELRNIEKYYNPGTINEMCLFDKFNLTVDKGEFVSVVGSNGSGKTSMPVSYTHLTLPTTPYV